MTDPLQSIATALERSPCLLVGQGGLANSEEDPLRASFSQRHGQDLYAFWLAGKSSLDGRAQTLRQIDKAISPAPNAELVFDFPWRCVVTSTIDSSMTRLLSAGNRRLITQIANANFSATTTEMNMRLLRLFGTVDREQLSELPPSDAKELRNRREVARGMLAQVPEIVTPSGTLMIAGWSPTDDWLRPRDLGGCLSRFAPGQVLMFGLSDAHEAALREDDDFSELLDEQVITLVRAPIADVFAALHEAGRLPAPTSNVPILDRIVYRVTGKRQLPEELKSRDDASLADVVFDRLDWQNLTANLFIPLDLDITAALPRDPVEQYQAFRDFISRPPGPHVLRFIRHLAVKRPVLFEALARCRSVIAESSPQETLLILRGQSGCGKSVVLCQLAVELRALGLPVVYVPHSPLPLDRNQIDVFCQQVEAETDASVFVLYDGLRDTSEYLDLAEYFASRARKCIVIGTGYTFQGDEPTSERQSRPAPRHQHGAQRSLTGLHVLYVDVPVELTGGETNELLTHIEKFTEASEEQLRKLAGLGINHFFAVVYRALPEARGPLEAQFLRECLLGAHFIDRTVQTLTEKSKPRTGGVLEQALLKALGNRLDALALGRRANDVDVQDDSLRTMSNASRALFDTVMFASWLGQEVPQSVGLRLLNQNFSVYRGTFTAGLLDERPVAPGIYVLSARHPLEASIWVTRHVTTPEAQIRLVRGIASTLDARQIAEDYDPALVFFLEILRALGPEGPRQSRQPILYAELADVVAQLRKLHNTVSVRLLLMESHAAREWVRERQWREEQLNGQGDVLGEFLSRLKEAESGLSEARERVLQGAGNSPPRATRRLLATLETERACVIGTELGSVNRSITGELLLSIERQHEADRWIKEAQQAWMKALRWDDCSRMAIDASCWILDERFRTGFVKALDELDWLSVWSEMLERYEALDLDDEQADRRIEKGVQFARRAGDKNRIDQLVARADARGSQAVHALLARFIAAQEDGGAGAACEYLERTCGEGMMTNHQVLPCYARLWWRKETGAHVFFPHERMLLPFDQVKWSRLLKLVDAWLAFEPEHTTLLFLRACSMVHLGRVEEGVQILRMIDRLGQSNYRHSKSLLIRSDADGKPVSYTAVFQGKTKGSAHLGWCDALRQNVEFFPLEHSKPDIRPGMSIGPFYLSLRYRGLFAEPTRRLKR